jgi:hypothetical protein
LLTVTFTRDDSLYSSLSREYGPYRAAEIVGDVLYVFDGRQTVELAARDRSGQWKLREPGGEAYTSVMLVPLPEPTHPEPEPGRLAHLRPVTSDV